MNIPDKYNPKKWIGSLGRRYGGKPFQVVRQFCYDAYALGQQCFECMYLAKGKYAPWHRDSRFYRKEYKEGDTPTPEVTGWICMLDGKMFHGGPTDRIRGILTTYREAKKRGVPFYIYWVDPFRIEDYLEPASFDWRIASDALVYEKGKSFPLIIEDETNLQSLMRMKAGLRLKYPQMHIYSNADNAIGGYRELFHEIFKPTDALQREVDRHLEAIGSRYWAFTYRFLNLLGDFKEWNRKALKGEKAEEFIERVIAEMLGIMKSLPEGYRVLVTSDSRRFLDIVKSRDPRIYVVPGDVKNIDLLKGEYPEAWMKTFTDQQLLMHAEKVYLMRTGRMYRSGFPRFAAEVGGAEFIDHKF